MDYITVKGCALNAFFALILIGTMDLRVCAFRLSSRSRAFLQIPFAQCVTHNV